MARARTFLDHVHELRVRLLVSALFFIAGGGIAYAANVPVLHALQHPFNQTLYYTTPAGAFNLVMKISLLGGVVLLMPALVYNIIAFVQPAMKKSLRKGELRLMTMLSLVLAVSGGLFAYLVIVPMSLKFFGGFTTSGFRSLISATDYVSYVINCLLAFVIIFQLPLAMLFADRVKPLSPKRLLKYEKFVVVGSLVIAFILPFTYDPVTQFIIAVPIILLYNLSIFLILWSHRSRRGRDLPLFMPVGSLFNLPQELAAVTVPVLTESDELSDTVEPTTAEYTPASTVYQSMARLTPRPVPHRTSVQSRLPAVTRSRPIAVQTVRSHTGRRAPPTPVRPAPPISRRVAITFDDSEEVNLLAQPMPEA